MPGPLWHTNVCEYVLLHGVHDVPDTHALYHDITGRVSSITAEELLFGAMQTTLAERNVRHVQAFLDRLTIEPFDDRAAVESAEIRMALRRLNRRCWKTDVMLVAHANVLGVPIATRFPNALVRIPSAHVWRVSFTAASSPRVVVVPTTPFPRTAPGRSRRPAPER